MYVQRASDCKCSGERSKPWSWKQPNHKATVDNLEPYWTFVRAAKKVGHVFSEAIHLVESQSNPYNSSFQFSISFSIIPI